MNAVALGRPKASAARSLERKPKSAPTKGLSEGRMRALRLGLLAILAVTSLAFRMTPLDASDRAGRGLRKRSSSSRQNEGLTTFAQPPAMRTGDQVWILSTHGAANCQSDSQSFTVERFVDGEGNGASVEDLLGSINSNDGRLNVVFVHGNRTNLYWAEQRGWLVYQQVISQCPDDQPVRLIIWAWPSQQVYGPVRDFRHKAQLADSEGSRFGWFLQRIDPARQLSLIGYSFGARVVLGGVDRVARQGFAATEPAAKVDSVANLLQHLDLACQQAVSAPINICRDVKSSLAESFTDRVDANSVDGTVQVQQIVPNVGELEHRVSEVGYSVEIAPSQEPVEPIATRRPEYRVALVAAALDREWLSSGGRLSAAYDTIDELLLINNSQDKAMKYFGFIPRGSFPTALGKDGAVCLQRLSDWGAKIVQFDVASVVGTEHQIELYFRAPTVVNRIHDSIFHRD